MELQGWELLTVHLFGTGKNCGGQVDILVTFPTERLKYCLFPLVLISDTVMDRQRCWWTGRFFYTFPKERQTFSVVSIPELWQCRKQIIISLGVWSDLYQDGLAQIIPSKDL